MEVAHFQTLSHLEAQAVKKSTTLLAQTLHYVSRPLARLVTLSAPACAAPTLRVEAIPASIANCGSPSFQWQRDGIPIPGATGPSYDIPAAAPPGTYVFDYLLSCTTPVVCGDRSAPLPVLVGLPLSPLLQLRRVARAPRRDHPLFRISHAPGIRLLSRDPRRLSRRGKRGTRLLRSRAPDRRKRPRLRPGALTDEAASQVRCRNPRPSPPVRRRPPHSLFPSS